LADVRKKDDEAQVVQDPRDGQVYLETTVQVDGLTEVTMQEEQEHMFADAAAAVNVDVHVLVVRRVFTVHGAFLLVALLCGVPFYMWSTANRTVVVVVLSVQAGGVFPLSYVLMLWMARQRRTYHTACAMLTWWTSFLTVMVCASLLLGDADTVVFQWAIAVWAQCMAMVVYASVSRRVLHAGRAALFMALATMLAWGASIALSFSARDWIASLVVLGVALACVPYHAYHVWAARSRYHAGWDDAVYAVVALYGEPVYAVVNRISATAR